MKDKWLSPYIVNVSQNTVLSHKYEGLLFKHIKYPIYFINALPIGLKYLYRCHVVFLHTTRQRVNKKSHRYHLSSSSLLTPQLVVFIYHFEHVSSLCGPKATSNLFSCLQSKYRRFLNKRAFLIYLNISNITTMRYKNY